MTGAARFARWMRRVAMAYTALRRCEAALALLRHDAEAAALMKNAPENAPLWLAAIDFQQRFVLGALIELSRFLDFVMSQRPEVYPCVARRAAEPLPTAGMVVDMQHAIDETTFACGLLVDATEEARVLIRAIAAAAQGGWRSYWILRLSRPERAMDAASRALERFAKSASAVVPELARVGLSARPPPELIS